MSYCTHPKSTQFVDLPGAERLGMDPEVLRLREGVQINRSLVAFAAVVRRVFFRVTRQLLVLQRASTHHPLP
jgi:hypothetical protein